ncbi:hypothetical protein [Actinoplanes couchii]|uniref:PBS lyase HEAT domain protein repeat-containing protein n=1 Tax=Actinoplanes couchii TaxID=403638 RepID=A0ABQ3XPM9_9ACTN|nr:hypothetical protein [Actinoplanes couchii]MDR6319100.1 hypothetical protein [Actinoplanes couchii]GID60441.1 hypothetical protein Aco03nite_088450 [Actinoplanes couchii]
MLEKLSEVPWARLGHAYGSAADVPDQIRALRSPDMAVRDAARRSLNHNIVHSGTRYEASAFAVPFLLELLADPATPERADLLALLTSLAIGEDESWLPGPFPVASYREQAAGGEPILRAAPLPSYEDDSVFRYVEALDDRGRESMFAFIELSAYDAVRAGVPLFRDLLSAADPGLRVAAAYALAWFPEEAAVVERALTASAADPDPAVAATALVALFLSGGPGAIFREALGDGRALVRWAAAVTVAGLDGPATGQAAVDELLGWAGRGRARFPAVPFLGGDLSGLAGLALRRLGDTHAGAAFETLLVRIPAVSGPEALPVVGEALRRAFPAGPVGSAVRFADLDQLQQKLLLKLADSPTTWQWGESGIFANFTLMVNAYGLPHSVEDMRSFVSHS